MLQHNGRLADQTDPIVRKIKAITAKGSKNMTDDDYDRRDQLEWEGGIYWADGVGIVIPSQNIERCLQMGAQKDRKGKQFASAVLCSDMEYPVEHTALTEAYGKSPDMGKVYNVKIGDIRRFVNRSGSVIKGSRLFRVRPMIPTGWTVKFTLEYDEGIINAADIKSALANAGALIGLSDWRPKFGRFIIESCK